MLCAGAPDTPEILAEVEGLVAELAQTRDGVVWIREMLPRADVVALLSAATAFVCPSIYEPLGIVNLEAMACETAVVATATGGIPEVVVHGETGLLVPIEQATDGTGTPLDPDQYVADFAEALTSVRLRPRPCRRDGPSRAPPCDRVVLVDLDRRADPGDLHRLGREPRSVALLGPVERATELAVLPVDAGVPRSPGSRACPCRWARNNGVRTNQMHEGHDHEAGGDVEPHLSRADRRGTS